MALPTIYVKTTGSATNSGSSDQDAANLSGAAATVAAAVVSLDGSPDLSGVATDGSATIHLNDASNSNQKIFKITAVDDVLKTVTVSVAPTGVVSSAWAIGGRFVYTPASIEGALAPGWTMEFGDTPASRSGAAFLTARTSGDGTSGYVKIIGKTGVRPKLTITDTNVVIDANSINKWWIENFELEQQGASGAAVTGSGGGWIFHNIKISDAGGNGMTFTGTNCTVTASEVTGVGGNGIAQTSGSTPTIIMGCYIHDLTGIGINFSPVNPMGSIIGNVIDTCGNNGIAASGASTNATNLLQIIGNTVYGCGNSGLEVTDADTRIFLMNNIFQDNGNAAGEYNVEFVAGSAEIAGWHGYNIFNHAGGGGGANLSGLTATATELTSDPLFVDAAGGDFSLKAGSPAKRAGYPGAFLGGSTGYVDIGAVQARDSTPHFSGRLG